jgi:hypothetical protein
LDAGTEAGEIIVCSDCGVDLEVTSLTLPLCSSRRWNRKIGENSGMQNAEGRVMNGLHSAFRFLLEILMQRRLKIGVLYSRVRVEENGSLARWKNAALIMTASMTARLVLTWKARTVACV